MVNTPKFVLSETSAFPAYDKHRDIVYFVVDDVRDDSDFDETIPDIMLKVFKDVKDETYLFLSFCFSLTLCVTGVARSTSISTHLSLPLFLLLSPLTLPLFRSLSSTFSASATYHLTF